MKKALLFAILIAVVVTGAHLGEKLERIASELEYLSDR